MMLGFRGLWAGTANAKKAVWNLQNKVPGYTVDNMYCLPLLFARQSIRNSFAELDRSHWAAAGYNKPVSFDRNARI